jgi:uncharacterized protein (DUF885 family)
LQWRRDSLAQMRADFDYEQLDEEAKTSWDLWVYTLDGVERAQPFRRHGFIFGRGGPHAEIPNFLINFHTVETVDDMRAYVARLNAIDDMMGQYLDLSRRAAVGRCTKQTRRPAGSGHCHGRRIRNAC